ncbi:MAG: toll/interleukin-1 receptor domain-containing protein [Planctomycetes bacterium]|nr:toll/interleukin-1 receptor domain-containing protein [Planctomycetota bacterium]
MSGGSGPKFELPGKLEKILAALSSYYGKNGLTKLQRVLVNSTYHVHEEWDYDNWNGGTYGHAVYFHVPSAVYFEVFDDLDGVAKQVCEGINKVANVSNEFISVVFFELQEDASLEKWREDSDALVQPNDHVKPSSAEQVARLWKPEWFRLFVGHKAEYKRGASALKDSLDYYGVSCFVAHEDIEPTKEWQDEIERALFSMDALVALLTERFSESRWTDQEIGVAFGRGILVIPVRLGIDPYGFIGKYQALAGDGKKPRELAREIYNLLWQRPALQVRLGESLVARFESSTSFEHANELVDCLENLEHLRPDLIDRLEQAPQRNSQVKGAFRVQSKLAGLVRRLRGAAG